MQLIPRLGVLIASASACGFLQAVDLQFVPLNQEVASRMIAVRDDKEVLTIRGLEAMRRSETLACSVGGNSLELVTLDREDEAGKPASVPIMLSEGLKSPLVLLVPDTGHPTGLRPITIDESEDSFIWGGLLFFNTCKDPLTIQIDKETRTLPADRSPVMIQPGGENRNMGVQIYKEGSSEDILFSGVWEHDANFRKIIVLVPPKNAKLSEFDLVIIPQDRRVKR